jgi:type II secretion system protein N
MNKRKILFFSAVIAWGFLVASFVIYWKFPYDKALRIALQNVISGSNTSVSLEGVSLKTMGIRASELLLRSNADNGNAYPVIRFSNLNINWRPLSLLKGTFGVDVQAAVYGGRLISTIDRIPVVASSIPEVNMKLDGIDMSRLPEGLLGFKGMTGRLDGWMRKEIPPGRPETQRGSFQLNMKNGEVREIQVKNTPRLIIPYETITLAGMITGNRVILRSIAMKSNLLVMKGSGTLENRDQQSILDLRISYEALQTDSPLSGKGIITISGIQPMLDVAIIPEHTPTVGKR